MDQKEKKLKKLRRYDRCLTAGDDKERKKKPGDSAEVAWSKDPKSEDQIAFDWEEGGSFAEKGVQNKKKQFFLAAKKKNKRKTPSGKESWTKHATFVTHRRFKQQNPKEQLEKGLGR